MNQRKRALWQGRGSEHAANDLGFRLPSFANLPRVLWFVNWELPGGAE